MEIQPFYIGIVGIASIASFLAAVLLVPYAVIRVKRLAVSGKTRAGIIEHTGFASALVRNGIPLFKSVSKMMLKANRADRFIYNVECIFRDKGYTTTRVAMGSLLCMVFLSAFLIGTAFGASAVVGLAAAGAALALIGVSARQMQEARRESLREAIPDALRSMSVCSHAGFSILQTFEQVSTEVPEPLRFLFRHAVHDLKTGKTVSEALDAFRENSDVSELAFVSVALDVQHRAGGSLQQVLDAARDSVESELALKRALKVQTAQAKLSARIVSIMPFILIAVFSFVSPGFLDPFFGSFEGMALLGLAVLMQVSGILIVRQLLDVEID